MNGMYGRRLMLALIASLAMHVAFALLAPKHVPPPPRPYRERMKPVSVSLHRQNAKAETKPKAEAKKPPEPRPEPPKPKAEPPKPKPEPPPPPKEAAPPPKEAPQPAKKLAPFVLSNVAMNGGVAVQSGSESNVFGDPTRDAKGLETGRDAPRAAGPAGSGTGGSGTAAPKKIVVKPPEAQNEVKGVYPEQHRDLGRVVRVELLLQVNAAGQVVEVAVRKGDLPAFDEEAKRTVRLLRFKPATRDGVPIPYQVPWTVVFLPEG